ncbi:MAG: DEAD/DEAH box helicase [Candidatus Aenigmatarchaeota archaeon]
MEYVSNRWIHPNKLERRVYQENIAKTALLGNTLCVLPTGMGKTPIAVLVAAAKLDEDMSKKIMLMAPTKPLTAQHRMTFEKFIRIGPSELVAITGEVPAIKRMKLYQKADIVFSTPQTIQNDLKARRLSLDDYSLLIFDEAHRCVGNYAYTYVAKAYVNQNPRGLILALTASPGGHKWKIDDVRRKLSIKNVEIRSRQDLDVVKYVQKIDEEKIEVVLTQPMLDLKKYLDTIKKDSLEKLKTWKVVNVSNENIISKTYLLDLQRRLQRSEGGFKYLAMSIVAEILKVDHAIGLLETQTLHSLYEYLQQLYEQGKNGDTRAAQRLIKNEYFEKALALTKKLIAQGDEHPKIEELKKLISGEFAKNKNARVIVFAQYRDTINKICNELKKVSGAKPAMFVGQAIKKGYGLKQGDQIKILNEFKLGFCNILCASSVGEEGIDVTETSLVIFYEPVPSEIRKIQRSGRTGRTKAGCVVTLITKNTRDEAYFWSAYHKEKKMKRTLEGMQKQKDLVNF